MTSRVGFPPVVPVTVRVYALIACPFMASAPFDAQV